MSDPSLSPAKAAVEAPRAPRRKPGWFEKRDRRRRKRIIFEEVLAWILVPAFLYLLYWGVQAIGGIPKEVRDFVGELVSIVLRGGK